MTKTETPPRHPDIEIYIKATSAKDISAWLAERFQSCDIIKQQGKVTHFRILHEAHAIPVMIVEKAAGIFTSVLFESDSSPWTQDIDCAREAFARFSNEVRCIANGWQDGDEPDEWLSISDAGEQTMLWRS